MLYQCYEMPRLALVPARALASGALRFLEIVPARLRGLTGRNLAAAVLASLEHLLREFGRPAFGLAEAMIGGEPVAVEEEVTWQGPWCELRHFRRLARRPNDPRLLLVAPLSGRHATLLRETMAAFLPDHDIFVSDWRNARDLPVAAPEFGLEDYIAHVIEFVRLLGPETHVVAVC